MTPTSGQHESRLSYETRILLLTLCGGLPAVVTLLLMLWTSDYTPAKLDWTLTLIVLGCWVGFAFSVRGRVVRPLQTSSNLLAALREGDFSVRARRQRPRGCAEPCLHGSE